MCFFVKDEGKSFSLCIKCLFVTYRHCLWHKLLAVSADFLHMRHAKLPKRMVQPWLLTSPEQHDLHISMLALLLLTAHSTNIASLQRESSEKYKKHTYKINHYNITLYFKCTIVRVHNMDSICMLIPLR